MLEARLEQASTLKRLLDAIKELVTDGNFECDEEGIGLQAMDNSHVALVSVKLNVGGFLSYRCDRPIPLGVNLNSLTKVLKCAKDDDQVTLKANDNPDVLTLVYDAKNSDRIAEYEMKLMDIDTDTLGIPDTEYDATITMSAGEFQRICRDLSQLGESVRIEVTKEGLKFTSEGEAANGSVVLKQTDASRARYKNKGDSSKKKVKKEEDEDVKMEGDDEEEEDDGGSAKEEEEEEENEDEEEGSSKKRKKSSKNGSGPAKKAKKSKKSKDDEEEQGGEGGVSIDMSQTVALTFSLKYLVNFAKSSSLTDKVRLRMSNEVPLLVEYDFGQGTIKYFLAPKIGDD